MTEAAAKNINEDTLTFCDTRRVPPVSQLVQGAKDGGDQSFVTKFATEICDNICVAEEAL
jgi:hypothetical protein